jgi:allantoinase
MMTELAYPRDLVGYAGNPPHPHWPNNARVALQIVLNYEEGAERNILHGDDASETLNSDMVGVQPWPGKRNFVMESLYEYGSRAGVWRLLQLFRERKIPITVFAVGAALRRNPEVARVIARDGHETAAHGWRWIDYRDVPQDVEAADILKCIDTIKSLTGGAPVGWYTGRMSANTRRLVVANGSFLYDSDAYNDDLPFWTNVEGRNHLIVPYTFDNNDMRFASAPGFDTGEAFFLHLKDAFDVLYAEGETHPKMMSVGLHCRLAGLPSRTASLQRFLDYVQRHDRVWICRRMDIARHWTERFPAAP